MLDTITKKHTGGHGNFKSERSRLEFSALVCQYCIHDRKAQQTGDLTGSCTTLLAQKLFEPGHYAYPKEIRISNNGEVVCDKFAIGEC